MSGSRRERILILCKTYPSPSGKHVETSCVAGVREDGTLIRLFPVPFRLIADEQQFKKWQWVSAEIYRAKDDRRPESHKIYVDTISINGSPIPTSGDWRARRAAIEDVPVHDGFAELDALRIERGVTLGIVRPSRILGLDITPVADAEWTAEEREKLLQNERQFGLFDAADARRIRTLRKLPFSFHYNYACVAGGVEHVHRHKLADWEVGALYWRCRREHGDDWQRPFRAKLEDFMSGRDLMLLMGMIHGFPDQWLIVSLLYPPRSAMATSRQAELAL